MIVTWCGEPGEIEIYLADFTALTMLKILSLQCAKWDLFTR